LIINGLALEQLSKHLRRSTVKNPLPFQEVKTSRNCEYKNQRFKTSRNAMVQPVTETRGF